MVKIDCGKCIGCGLCAADCLALNIEVKEGKAAVKEECLQCGHCVAVCPANAVSIPEYDMDDVEEYQADSFQLDPSTVLRAIKFRRSIRSYQEKDVPRESLELLAQAGRYTATAVNNQGSYFVFVKENLNELKDRVWSFIDRIKERDEGGTAGDLMPYIRFNRRRKADPRDDYLFRNAPVVLFITSDWPLDAGLAAQNIENLAVSLGLGALYNGYLVRIVQADEDVKEWLGIEGKTIKACMLLGYPARRYIRTAPRKEPNIIWR